MSDKTRKAIAARIQRLAEIRNPKPKASKPKESGGTQGQS